MASCTLEELADAVHATEPAAYLVLPRVLRRVIKLDRRVSGFGLNVPHRKSYWVDRKRLLEMVDRSELTPQPVHELPKLVLLLAQPDPEKLASMPADALLRKYWRLLFHLKVHAEFDENFNRRELTRAAIRRRIHLIGQTEFDEIRGVLRHEDFLLPPRDARTAYVEFAALYLELKHFAPQALPRYFPALRNDFDRVDKILAMDVDDQTLLEATRLPGCTHSVEPTSDLPSAPSTEVPEFRPSPCPEALYTRLMRRSERARNVGNYVRSAVLRARAQSVLDPVLAKRASDGAGTDLRHLVRRLQEALNLTEPQTEDLLDALTALLRPTQRARWTGEARLLYDLQKVCVDHEREVSTVDVIEWLLSRGKVPIHRSLPYQREVLMTKHLRSALNRLAVARIPHDARVRLEAILEEAEHEVEERMRREFRPHLHSALDMVGLHAVNVPERVARRKVIEELLDRIAERGFLTMSDLRDSLSRNNLKLSDLTGPKQLVFGDQLLKCDKELAESLDGVYRRGEFYLRWLQRLSSLAFGTKTGRWLTRYLFLPFGVSYVALEGMQHLVGPLVKKAAHTEIHLMNPVTCVVIGFFLLGMLHVEEFRKSVLEKLGCVGGAIKSVFVRLPAYIRELPAVRRVMESRAFLLTFRLVIKPFLWTCFLGLVLPSVDLRHREFVLSSLAVFLTLSLFWNSNVGRHVEEVATDYIARTWRWLRVDIIAGAFRLIMGLFNRALETVERMLYIVDEWFRFKSGESRSSLIVKGVFGTVWFFVQYVIRFCVNLLIEPQVNPIKHFPVVTVSHKIILPLTPTLISLLTPIVGKIYAGTLGTAIIFSIPGIFGFLVWELKENWRLYAANRSRNLQPVLIGHHGETMLRFMRPGFHSGTLPKLFAKLRRAERRSQKSGSDRAVRKLHQQLHHVEHSLRRFAQRELIVLLRQSRCWGEVEVAVDAIRVSSNRVEILLTREGCEQAAVIAFEEQSGKLLASFTAADWVEELEPEQRNALRNAIAGLYKLAGVHLIRNQVRALVGEENVAFDISGNEMVVWPEDNYAVEVTYDLRSRPLMAPSTSHHRYDGRMPVLRASQLLYFETPITWPDWVEAWRHDQEEECLRCRLATGFHLLSNSESEKRGCR